MRRWISALCVVVLFLVLAAASCLPPAPGNYKLVWADEFNGTAVDTTKWNVQNNSTFGSGNHEQECYMAGNTTVSGGSLNLAARAGGAGCSGYTVSSGMVTTRAQQGTQKFAFTHGYAEARIKVGPLGPAAWPAFWLVGGQGAPGWPAYGEIDVVEMYGLQPGIAETAYHNSSGKHGGSATNMGSLSDYHVYAVEWTPTKIVWWFDNKIVSSYNTANSYSHTIILNYAIGGAGPEYYGYNGNPSSSLPSVMSVDYVRIWKL